MQTEQRQGMVKYLKNYETSHEVIQTTLVQLIKCRIMTYETVKICKKHIDYILK